MPRNYNKLIGKIVEVFGTRAVFAQHTRPSAWPSKRPL